MGDSKEAARAWSDERRKKRFALDDDRPRPEMLQMQRHRMAIAIKALGPATELWLGMWDRNRSQPADTIVDLAYLMADELIMKEIVND